MAAKFSNKELIEAIENTKSLILVNAGSPVVRNLKRDLETLEAEQDRR